MTILLALEMIDQGRISLDDVVTVSADAAGMGGSQVLLDISEQQTVGILLKSMIRGKRQRRRRSHGRGHENGSKRCASNR